MAISMSSKKSGTRPLQFFSLVIGMLAYEILFCPVPLWRGCCSQRPGRPAFEVLNMWPNASGATHLCEALHEWGGYRSDTGLSKKRSRTLLMPAIGSTARYKAFSVYGRIEHEIHGRPELTLGSELLSHMCANPSWSAACNPRRGAGLSHR
jgi:hypothetical protein